MVWGGGKKKIGETPSLFLEKEKKKKKKKKEEIDQLDIHGSTTLLQLYVAMETIPHPQRQGESGSIQKGKIKMTKLWFNYFSKKSNILQVSPPSPPSSLRTNPF